MNSKGFSIIKSQNIWTPEQAEIVRGLLRSESNRYADLFFATIDRIRTVFPPEIGANLLSYLRWVHDTVNSQLGPVEGPLYIKHIQIRQYSRTDFTFHVHGSRSGSSYIGVNKSESGWNTVISEDGGKSHYAAPEGSSVFFTEMGRSVTFQDKIPATLHGSPPNDPRRILVLVDISSERRDQMLIEKANEVYRQFTLLKPSIKTVTVNDLLELLEHIPSAKNWEEINARIVLEYSQLRANDLVAAMSKLPKRQRFLYELELQRLLIKASFSSPEIKEQVRLLFHLPPENT